MASSNSISPDWDTIIVGGGAAGLMAAARAAERGRRTLVLEKNRKIGVKILMSGGTRCNITHDCSPREIADQFGRAGKFLYKALGQFPPQEVIRLIESEGVATKVESTGKIFPVSDRALDVRDALWRRAERLGAVFLSGVAVREVYQEQGRFQCVADDQRFSSESLLLAVGGKSYPGCGTTGDGYAWARAFGHEVTATHPALTPLVSTVEWVREISGVTLERVGCSAHVSRLQKPMAQREGALLFTHQGLSGPEPMNLSRFVTMPGSEFAREICLDFLPSMSADALLQHFRSRAQSHGRATVGTSLPEGLPRRLVEAVFANAQVPTDQRLADFSARQQQALIGALKQSWIPISGTRGFEKAEVTAGGVALGEVHRETMESKRLPRLFFAGEILDVDGPIGGFNFQAAFSTGDLAGRHL